MIIENPDIFKTWLTSILEPLCDADPAALAKYVYALVKKEKPLDELRDGMLDQLDVFLQKETKPFVEMLFTALESKEYLKNEEKQLPPNGEPETGNHIETEADGDLKLNGSTEEAPRPPPLPSPPALARGRAAPSHLADKTALRPPIEQTLVKVLPTELLEEPLEQLPRRRDRRSDSARERDERRRRSERSWERRRRRRDDVEPLPPTRRGRSRSPVPRKRPLPERERDRMRGPREMERDRISRDRDHRERVSMSRDRERSRSRSCSPGVEGERMSPLPLKRRCRDFDEKGYCMRGDLCQWDHGADPLVLEDAAIALNEYNPQAPDIWSGVPPFPLYATHPPRELVPIPRIREVPPPGIIPPQRPAASPAHLQQQQQQHLLQQPQHPQQHRMPPPHKKNFDYGRLGGNHRAPHHQPPNPGNCSLEVKKVPMGLNDITHLNKHFSKFGKIVNIQVCYEGDPEAALITFSQPSEASVAYKSTEAVLNNRFIKLFWHKPQSKQENVPPPNSAVNKVPPRPVSQHPTSQNKVLINKDNKPKVDPAQANAQTNAQGGVNKSKEECQSRLENGSGGDSKEGQREKEKERPEVVKQVMEMHARAQDLLHCQLADQTARIARLETGQVTGQAKAALVEAISSAQEGIEKLRKSLVAYNKMLKQIQASTKRPKTREEAQKEILDAELDLFTKQQEGQDVTELTKKIAELRRNMAAQFPPHPSARRPHPSRGGRFNPATRFVRNNNNNTSTGAGNTAASPAQKTFNNQSVDHRPRTVLVSGFEADECDALIKHFMQYGEVTGKEINLSVPEVRLQYRLRAHAELAAARARHFNERTLTITWVPNKPLNQQVAGSESNSTKSDNNNEDSSQDPVETLRFDEEEDDDEEERSWRR